MESFHGRLRDELLKRELFTTLLEAEVLIERWRIVYNTIRPHSALNYRPPAPETKEWIGDIGSVYSDKFRDECLKLDVLDTFWEAKVLVEGWRIIYNTIRPHSALGYLPPAPETKEWISKIGAFILTSLSWLSWQTTIVHCSLARIKKKVYILKWHHYRGGMSPCAGR